MEINFVKMTEQDVLMDLIEQGEWTAADGSVFIFDNLEDEEW